MNVHLASLKARGIERSDRKDEWAIAASFPQKDDISMNREALFQGVVALTATILSCAAMTASAAAASLSRPSLSEVNVSTVEHRVGIQPASTESGSLLPNAQVLNAPQASPLLMSQRFNTEFPLPDSVSFFQNLQGPGEAAINFQTGLNMNQAIAFYRQQFAQLGLTERAINTAITDGTFSLIFDAWSNGKPVMIQGVSMGRSTNINIHLSDR